MATKRNDTKKIAKTKKTPLFGYRIIAFREFDTARECGGISIDTDNWNILAAVPKKTIITKHIAVLEVRNWLFRKGLTTVYGQAAQELVEEAKKEGVYFKGDPGKCAHDRKISSAPKYYRTATGASSWGDWASTTTATTSASWYTNYSGA